MGAIIFGIGTFVYLMLKLIQVQGFLFFDSFESFQMKQGQGTGPRSAARFKPEVHPRTVPQKCSPEVHPRSKLMKRPKQE